MLVDFDRTDPTLHEHREDEPTLRTNSTQRLSAAQGPRDQDPSMSRTGTRVDMSVPWALLGDTAIDVLWPRNAAGMPPRNAAGMSAAKLTRDAGALAQSTGYFRRGRRSGAWCLLSVRTPSQHQTYVMRNGQPSASAATSP